MNRDPAFLMYSKDWLQGTAKMTLEEKGIYIDFLCHQHQDGFIPSDTKRLSRMAGLPESEFLRIWEGVNDKFKPISGNQLVNQKLVSITTERSTKGLKNTITGNFASIIRLGGFTDEEKAELKKSFKIDYFLTVSKEKITERLNEWIVSRLGPRLKSIVNANGTVNISEGGMGGWPSMPGRESLGLELPEIKMGAAKELYYFSNDKASLTSEQIDSLWNIFKKQNFTGSRFYANPEETFSHFINWSKTQKINGSNKQPIRKGGKSTGLHQVIASLKEDLESGA